MGRPARARPTRSCIACRTAREKRDLVRVVRTPAGELRLDASGRLAGRGAYLCPDAACWQAAVRRHLIERALGQAPGAELLTILSAGPADRGGRPPNPYPELTSNEGDIRGT